MVHTIAILFAVKHGLGRHVLDIAEHEGASMLRSMARVGSKPRFRTSPTR